MHMLFKNIDEQEVDALIAILNKRGIAYLVGDGAAGEDVKDEDDPVRLIQRLAGCGYPLVESACISLFLLHPEMAPCILEAMERGETDLAEDIAALTLATIYMQRWWVFRLTFAFGHLPAFPETMFTFLWKERDLPEPEEKYGIIGLLALQEYQQRRFGLELNFREDWQNQINHLLAQEDAYHRSLDNETLEVVRKLARGEELKWVR
jgi:hypothetical protein